VSWFLYHARGSCTNPKRLGTHSNLLSTGPSFPPHNETRNWHYSWVCKLLLALEESLLSLSVEPAARNSDELMSIANGGCVASSSCVGSHSYQLNQSNDFQLTRYISSTFLEISSCCVVCCSVCVAACVLQRVFCSMCFAVFPTPMEWYLRMYNRNLCTSNAVTDAYAQRGT